MTVLLVILASCSHEKTCEGVLSTIPSRSKAVARVDLPLLLKQSGCAVAPASDAIMLSPQVEKLLGDYSAPLSTLAAIVPAIGADAVYFFSADTLGVGTALTFAVTEPDRIAELLPSGAPEATGVDGLTACPIDADRHWTLVCADTQGWLLRAESAEAAVKCADTMRRITGEKSLASHAGVAAFLQQSAATVTAVWRYGQLLPRQDSAPELACMELDINDQALDARISVMNADGSGADLTCADTELATDFLTYLPSEFIFAAAVAPGVLPWDRLADIVGAVVDADRAPYLHAVAAVMSQIDGPIAVGFGPAGGAPAIADINFSTWDFFIMAHMPQTAIDNVTGMLRLQSVAKPAVGADGSLALDLPGGATLRVDNMDGYLTVTNRDLSAGQNSALAEAFGSCQAAVALNIAAGSETVKAFDLPWGIGLTARAGRREATVRLTLNGVNGSVLQNIVEAAATRL